MLPRLDVTQSGGSSWQVPFEIQPKWLAAQQRCGYTAVNIAKGVDTKLILYLERRGELNSSNSKEVQDFLYQRQRQPHLVANFGFVFPFQIP